MISVLTLAFRKYLETPFEDFTSKLILALSIFELLDTYSDEDLERLQEIETYTNNKVYVNFYKLDRVVNPSKGEFQATDNKFKFLKENKKENAYDDNTITLTENQIQKYLCLAVREINQIIFRNLKAYKVEQSIEGMESDNDDVLSEILK